MKRTAVIMAGGRGERFWPKSRLKYPKQFLSFTDDNKTMLQLAAERIAPVISPEDTYIVTGGEYAAFVREQLPQVPAENILIEPAPRSTAPCVGLAAMVIARKYGDALTFVLPSDHLIQDNAAFVSALLKAEEAAEAGGLVTIGITPHYPETEYGYIRCSGTSAIPGVLKAERFVEKPNIATARRYLARGQYLWNSGMFIWKASVILERFAEFLPEVFARLQALGWAWGAPDFPQLLEECYSAFPAVSVDVGIMEKARNVYTVPGDFGWDDAGSWLAMARLNGTDEHGNTVLGDVVSINAQNCIFSGRKKLIAAVGVQDLVVVDTPDAVLICDKTRLKDVRQVLAQLKSSGRSELL